MKLEQEIFQQKFRNEYQKAAVNIAFTNIWLAGFHSQLLKRENMTSQQYNILRILRSQHPRPASVKTIRERMMDRMSDASRIVEKLRQKGLVERRTSEHDRRNVDVTITQKGLDLLNKLDYVEQAQETYLSNLNEAEIAQLNQLLDKLRG